jgi:hypothetical protein
METVDTNSLTGWDESNSNQSYYEYPTLDYVLTNVAASTWFMDSLNTYPFIILGMIGMLLNLFSFAVFSDPEFGSLNLYQYLRVYTLN